MNILYLTEDNYSKVHKELCLSLVSVREDIYVTHLSINRKSLNRKRTKDIYSHTRLRYVLLETDYNHFLYKWMFPYKMKKKWELINGVINVQDFDLIYASTSFSDGCIAYKAFQTYQIPYVVAVRTTDICLYLKKMFFLYFLGKNIFSYANRIICISESIKKSLCSNLLYKSIIYKLSHKIYVNPNGIDDYWLNNRSFVRRNSPFVFLYVGAFDQNKNVVRLIKSFINVHRFCPQIRLKLIGEKGSQESIIRKYCREYSFIEYRGAIYDKSKLLEEYRSSDVFVMVSKRETFGLVYVEALSQGLPLIYSQKTGFDGMFPDLQLGESCNPKDCKSIQGAILRVINRYADYQYLGESLYCFQWKNVAMNLLNIISEKKDRG